MSTWQRCTAFSMLCIGLWANKTGSERAARCSFYERHIRVLTVGHDMYLDLGDGEVQSIILGEVLHGYLDMLRLRVEEFNGRFPGLLTLRVAFPRNLEIQDAIFSMARICLVPSLCKVWCSAMDVFIPSTAFSSNAALAFFQAIPARCPHLQVWHLDVEESEDVMSDDFAAPSELISVTRSVISQVPNLCCFAAPAWCLIPSIYDALARQPLLGQIKITDSNESVPDYYDLARQRSNDIPAHMPWFPRLGVLHFQGHEGLVLDVLPDPARMGSDGSTISQMPLLHTVDIFAGRSDAHEDPSRIPSLVKIINYLQYCPKITQLELFMDFAPAPSDADIELIATPWPALQALCISPWSMSGRAAAALTLKSLLILAARCQEIDRIDLHLCHGLIPEVPAQHQISRASPWITLSLTQTTSEDFLRRFFRRLWPGFRRAILVP
ncbi:hypothetical protein DACRYDRAFT_114376 [Dacryopinax primogenitus]|uniref:F-box domain-containing protein n=1 Tax=Dacryopinax primogenitus (strain DJM 731) TaxID=1858805 RepID=M5GE57_DACPD|nr:uncharacterized protein DACRYDRAFT_114376 [Dacryopinax primogenitus]EJU05102.1 hypothetical protein DACRYDRAFT_114376 [Dacryopinax primogenitus]